MTTTDNWDSFIEMLKNKDLSEFISNDDFKQLEKDEFVKGNVVIRDENYQPVIIPIEVGMPATMYIGSDSYATEITAVNYFKSGNRAGQVKSVEIKWFDGIKKFTAKIWEHGVSFSSEYYSLGLGYATDYRDPHF